MLELVEQIWKRQPENLSTFSVNSSIINGTNIETKEIV